MLLSDNRLYIGRMATRLWLTEYSTLMISLSVLASLVLSDK